jgi:AcrR family transcriptional regulator
VPSTLAALRYGSIGAAFSDMLASVSTKKRSKAQATGPRGPTGIQLGDDVVRAMVMRGAAKVFAQRGVRLASIDDILEASRISRRTFYRLYDNKEDVMLALYRIGTDRLVDGCRQAVSQETEPLRQIELCIDAHLRTAQELGRLVFVLGGEAQHHESQLHPVRIGVHEALTTLLAEGASARWKTPIDPLVFRALVLALEGLTRAALEAGDEGRRVQPATLERTRKVMIRIATATLFGEGPGVAALPAAP